MNPAGTMPPALRHSDPAPRGAMPVRAVGLCKAIDERPILRGIDLEISAGSFVALLGANGAGKSTLLKILSTLGAPTGGTLELFGETMKTSGVGAAKIRARIGLIGHQSMLYHDLSARENLEFFGKLYGVNRPRERAMTLLTALGLAERAGDAVKAFSRGMAQRVSIARALMHDPELLLADEPFAGLDAPSTAILERVLTSLHESGKTIILANHDIGQSLRLSQRAVVIRKGQKVIDAASTALDAKTVLATMEAA